MPEELIEFILFIICVGFFYNLTLIIIYLTLKDSAQDRFKMDTHIHTHICTCGQLSSSSVLLFGMSQASRIDPLRVKKFNLVDALALRTRFSVLFAADQIDSIGGTLIFHLFSVTCLNCAIPYFCRFVKYVMLTV